MRQAFEKKKGHCSDYNTAGAVPVISVQNVLRALAYGCVLFSWCLGKAAIGMPGVAPSGCRPRVVLVGPKAECCLLLVFVPRTNNQGPFRKGRFGFGSREALQVEVE